MISKKNNKLLAKSLGVVSPSEFSVVYYILLKNLDGYGWGIRADEVAKGVNLTDRSVRRLLNSMPYIRKDYGRPNKYELDVDAFEQYIDYNLHHIERCPVRIWSTLEADDISKVCNN